MNIVGLIPARGGSKGVPRKNIKKLADKPLIQYTIEEAKKSNKINRLIVSTDDEEIANISEELGTEVIKRPEELSQDDTPTLPVIQHTIEELEKEGNTVDAIILLQPTTPFRKQKHIDEAITLFLEKNPESVISIGKVPGHFSPFWQISLEETYTELFMRKYDKEIKTLISRRQDLPDTYYRDGAIYITKKETILSGKLIGDICVPYIIKDKNFINIDTNEDFEYAEYILNNEKNKDNS